MIVETKAYGQFSSTLTQRPVSKEPVKVVLDTQQSMSGNDVTIDFINDGVTINKSGQYLVIAGSQISKIGGSAPRWIDFWLRINDKDIPNSNVRATIREPQVTDVLVTQTVTQLHAGDRLNIMMAVEAPDEGVGIEAIKPKDEPLIPSLILTVLQL